MRLLAGLLAGQSFDSVLTGDDSLRGRPMGRIIEPLAKMGATIRSQNGKAPLIIHGRNPLKAISYATPVASAQLKSCLMLASLNADGFSQIHEDVQTRDHTERMFRHFGVETQRDDRS
jgi:3-phosphoshikimate 1-carboxyvinyltransferase